ncbi:dihydrofolate reductase [Lactobacillus sp. PV037]|uniref:dihydrofolate reductase n=1 Tax=unclassified Lactobacillus TaxID=2620435 RepID=UPI00223F953A|nr:MULTISPECIES: dihydrofolate reductase [unclassified Lactobacillus]QNQ82150.1 dihydrofolate reductase [Lactobacillus sp. PV012]QNQ83741.1 dihydrofolate reductase [Lactobacillus sp. PV037]
MLGFIWSEDLDGNIGYQGKLPWQLPADLKHFREKTLGHSIIMGRKTFESLPQLLPERLHVVITTNTELKEKYKNSEIVKIFRNIRQLRRWIESQEGCLIWVIGGTSLFKEFKDEVSVLERTIIQAYVRGDVKMPEIEYSKFELINEECHWVDVNNKYNFTFLTYQKRVSIR